MYIGQDSIFSGLFFSPIPLSTLGSDLRPLSKVLQRVELIEPRWLQRRALVPRFVGDITSHSQARYGLPDQVNIQKTMERSTIWTMGTSPLFRLGHFQ